MKDYEKYEKDLRERFAEQYPNPTPEQSTKTEARITGLVTDFLAQKNMEAIERGA